MTEKKIKQPKIKLKKAPTTDYLQNWLVRSYYLNSLFGVKDFENWRQWLADKEEGTDTNGHTFFFTSLLDIDEIKSSKLGIGKIEEYDGHICAHLKKINTKREIPVKLKYYQWIAALYTEAYLDKYFSLGVGKLSQELDDSLSELFQERHYSNLGELKFAFTPENESELAKCGLWMATGSGKTFLIHLNYLQFLDYNKGPFKKDIDRVILVTPSANLTAQHLHEFDKSGISAVEFNPDSLEGYFSGDNGLTINVIETTKLIENKSDNGKKRVDVAAFGKKNLVFVDEAHKGSSSDESTTKSGWIRLREKIAENGWTFEYSATFGQAAEGNTDNNKSNIQNDIFTSFAKTIIFDYSYRYFYNDGYGKEYRVFNVEKSKYDVERILLGNLLTFYEQKLVYSQYPKIVAEYNIDDPLWIFVGNKVIVKETKKDAQKKVNDSDVLTVLQFFAKYLSDKSWAIQTITEFLSGKSGLIDEFGNDLFGPAFPDQRLRYLRNQNLDAETVYQNILKTVFRTTAPNKLRLVRLKNTDGEIGIKCGDSPDFFAEIYIGDAETFINCLNDVELDMDPPETISHPSLFMSIGSDASTVNVLIGAKKFIEGWDCYRVSSMGLLNVGQKAGSTIIQLFGRGVRLHGKNNSLKRSTYNAIPPNNDIPILETLNIFGINANYIGKLRDYFNHESLKKKIEKTITIKKHDNFIRENLLIPKMDKYGFTTHENVVFTIDDVDEKVTLDLRSYAETEDSEVFKNGLKAQTIQEEVVIDAKYLDYLDWTRIYFALLAFKEDKGWYNIIFSQNLLESIIRKERYTLYCTDDVISPSSFSEMERVEDVVILILKKALQGVYTKKQNKWSYLHAKSELLNSSDDNFVNYKVLIDETEIELSALIDNIIKNVDAITIDENQNYVLSDMSNNKTVVPEKNKIVSDVWCDKHLFQPLLAVIPKAYTDIMTICPTGLNKGEIQFVTSIENYVNDENNAEYFKNHQFYLLRNLPKNGIGFYDSAWFYPDFILWIKNITSGIQRIVFVDPKGLAHLEGGFEHEKVKLYKNIKLLEDSLNKKLGNKKLVLDSYIISNTDIGDLTRTFGGKHSKDEYAKHHILFWDTDYVNRIILDSD